MSGSPPLRRYSNPHFSHPHRNRAYSRFHPTARGRRSASPSPLHHLPESEEGEEGDNINTAENPIVHSYSNVNILHHWGLRRPSSVTVTTDQSSILSRNNSVSSQATEHSQTTHHAREPPKMESNDDSDPDPGYSERVWQRYWEEQQPPGWTEKPHKDQEAARRRSEGHVYPYRPKPPRRPSTCGPRSEQDLKILKEYGRNRVDPHDHGAHPGLVMGRPGISSSVSRQHWERDEPQATQHRTAQPVDLQLLKRFGSQYRQNA
ncbi:hypothetical protein T439DRAFT_359572 [Meredithblackwellia eburnea MCA 4105]